MQTIDLGRFSNLLDYCVTNRQREILNQCIESGNKQAAADDLGINYRSVQRCIDRIEMNAAERGYSPAHDMNNPTPNGFKLKGTSTLYDEDGRAKLQWVKTTREAQIAESLANILEDYHYRPAPKVKKPKKASESNLLSLYTLTDYHLGMYAWKKETGADWDTDIASTVMVNAINDMVDKSPRSKLAILNIQGDFLHWDGLEAITPSSGHILDADTRFERMIELSIDLNVWAIERLLIKHEKVRVVICEGNHDLAGSAWLRKCIKKIMRDNPRVEIDDTAIPYYAYLHGNIMLGFHHGHKKKNTALPTLFSSEPRYRKMWGDSEYCYIHTGHYHQTEQDMSEGGGAIVERHPTLAAPDAYAVRGGYVSRRGARMIVYDKQLGEVERVSVMPRDQ